MEEGKLPILHFGKNKLVSLNTIKRKLSFCINDSFRLF